MKLKFGYRTGRFNLSLMLSGTPIDISDEMLSIGIDVLLFVIDKFAISVVSR